VVFFCQVFDLTRSAKPNSIHPAQGLSGTFLIDSFCYPNPLRGIVLSGLRPDAFGKAELNSSGQGLSGTSFIDKFHHPNPLSGILLPQFIRPKDFQEQVLSINFTIQIL
jgi:hypothetical protein